jgi:hypothetical protein
MPQLARRGAGHVASDPDGVVDDLRASLISNGRAVAETRRVTNYYRMSWTANGCCSADARASTCSIHASLPPCCTQLVTRFPQPAE